MAPKSPEGDLGAKAYIKKGLTKYSQDLLSDH
ncbi:MAG: hypothetical protein JWO58_620 [Chitinophagaceae bacterium]|nr:hypothetical protein [Chitinophagaceae bacterium]